MAAPILTFGQRQQALNGLPFYGRGDFSFVASQNDFSTGISVKVLPLSDMSRPEQLNVDDFETEIQQLSAQFKAGSRIGGIVVNSTFKDKKGTPKTIIGKFECFKIDRKHKNIRAFIRDPKTLKLVEVYPETLSRLNESSNGYAAKTFVDFLI